MNLIFKKKLSSNDSLFLKRVYATPQKIYENRLKAINFVDKEKVLDAGCGFGQWSLALSQLNKQVEAVDVDKKRINFLSEICEKKELFNINTQRATLEKLPYKNGSFDAVFCYGVIFGTSWMESLKELIRVLKKKGVLYLTANGIGWQIYLWRQKHNETKDYKPSELVPISFQETLNYKINGQKPKRGQIIIEPEEMLEAMKKYGMKIIQLKGEGKINLASSKIKPKSFFKEKYYGLTGVYEILAQKK